MGEITLGTGATRLDARENASQLMVEKIGIGKKKKAKATTSTAKTDKAANPADTKEAATKKVEETKKDAQPKKASSKKKTTGYKPKKHYQSGKKKAAKTTK